MLMRSFNNKCIKASMPPISSIIDATNFLLLFCNSVHIELERFMETMPFCDGFPISSYIKHSTISSVVATLTTWFLLSYQTISQRLNNLNYTESYSTLCDPINSFTVVINSICPVFVLYLSGICIVFVQPRVAADGLSFSPKSSHPPKLFVMESVFSLSQPIWQ